MFHRLAAVLVVFFVAAHVKASYGLLEGDNYLANRKLFSQEIIGIVDMRAKIAVFCLKNAGHNVIAPPKYVLQDEKLDQFEGIIRDQISFAEYIRVAKVMAFIENILTVYTERFELDLSLIRLDELSKDYSPDDFLAVAHQLFYQTPKIAKQITEKFNFTDGFTASKDFLARADEIEELIHSARFNECQVFPEVHLLDDLKRTRSKLILHLLEKNIPVKLNAPSKSLPISDKFFSTSPQSMVRFSSSLDKAFDPDDFAQCVVDYLGKAHNRSTILSKILGHPCDCTTLTLHINGLAFTTKGPFKTETVRTIVANKEEKDFYKTPAPFIQDMVFSLFIEEYLGAYFSSIRKTFDPDASQTGFRIEPKGTPLEQAFREAMMIEFRSLFATDDIGFSLYPLASITPAIEPGEQKAYQNVRNKIIAHYLSTKIDKEGKTFEVIVPQAQKRERSNPTRDRLRKKLAQKQDASKPTENPASKRPSEDEQSQALKSLLDESEQVSKLEKEIKSAHRKLDKKNRSIAELKEAERHFEERISHLTAELKEQDKRESQNKELREENQDLITQLSAMTVERDYHRQNAQKAQHAFDMQKMAYQEAVRQSDKQSAEVDALHQRLIAAEEQLKLQQKSESDESTSAHDSPQNIETLLELSKTLYSMYAQQSTLQQHITQLKEALVQSQYRAQQAEASYYNVLSDPYVLEGTFSIGGRELTLSQAMQFATLAVQLENQGVDLVASLKEAENK